MMRMARARAVAAMAAVFGLAAVLGLGAVGFGADSTGSPEAKAGALRPAAVPLVTCDPYFSVWSFNDELAGGATRHWTGKVQPLTSLVRVDGKTYRVMGGGEGSGTEAPPPAARQVGLTVMPTRTVYEFEESGVHLSLTFMTPLLADDLMVCSRPVTYVTWSAKSVDGKEHSVEAYLDASALLAVNSGEQVVTYGEGERVSSDPLKQVRPRTGGAGMEMLWVGTVEQPVLETRGDDRRIDWGYFYLAGATKDAGVLPAGVARGAFVERGAGGMPAAKLPGQADAGHAPVLAMEFSLGKVGDRASSAHAILAYDDVVSVRYFNEDLKAYWKKDGATIGDLLRTAEADYDALVKRCEAFDAELVGDLRKIGGESYVWLGALAWRQALAAQKLCADSNGQPLMFSKENFSNGCISTVDVLYPAAPQMLAFCPTMLKASMVPLMDYASSPRWKHDSAPHDLGTYPQATGQVYGGEATSPMPVEESGNMLVLMGALAKAEGNAGFAKKYWATVTTWEKYLEAKGLDPENQLCTDDFAGHIARNANLSVKAIMGIASYGMMADMLGQKDESARAMGVAREYAKKWMVLAEDGDHYKLVFGDKGEGTWSQKYNLAWDRILGFDVFPPEVAAKEMAYYRTKMNRYGLPLDSRKDYTKLDWELWTATLATKDDDFRMIVDACARWVNATSDRVPMSDWYDTKTGRKSGFQARSVVGGLFIPFLKDEGLWKKYALRDKANAGGWAAVDFSPPVMKAVVPAADTEAGEWRYTTEQPAGNWRGAGFDDSSWAKGKGGFGTEGTPGARVGTRWDSSDIWIRREVVVPEGVNLRHVRLWVHHDEDAEIFINGARAARPRGFATGYSLLNLADPAAGALHAGKNVIAVHCHQTTGGQYVDVGLVEVEGKKK